MIKNKREKRDFFFTAGGEGGRGGGGEWIATNTFGIGGIFPAEWLNADHVNDHPKPKERLFVLNRYNHISMLRYNNWLLHRSFI